MTIKEEFIAELSKVNREGIDKLISWLDKSDFYVAPCSTTYHFNKDGGLVEHSLNVLKCLKELMTLHFDVTEVDGKTMYGSFSEETLIICALLHDICKANTYKKIKRNRKNERGQWEEYDSYEVDEKFIYGHGTKSVFILQQYIKLTINEALAIRFHMGGFENYNQIETGPSQVYPKEHLALFLHLADMTATYFLEEKIN